MSDHNQNYEFFIREAFLQRNESVPQIHGENYILLACSSNFLQSNIVNVKAAVAFAIATYNATIFAHQNYEAFVIEVFGANTLDDITDIINRYKQATNFDNLIRNNKE